MTERRRPRWRRITLIVLAVCALVAIIVVSRRTLAQSLTLIGHLNWTWFLLALVSEAVSLAAFGLSRRLLLRANGNRAPFSSVMAITYASNALSMSLPFAGTQLAAVFSYRQFRRLGIDSAVTGWALALSAIVSSSALALVLVIGALAGGASVATAAGFAGAAVFILPAAAVLLALRYRQVRVALNRIITRFIRALRRLLRRQDIDVSAMEEFLDRVASIKLPRHRYAEVFALAVVNWLADCGCLACAIRATGQGVPWHGLLLAYGAGAAVGSTGVTPGGFAIVEVTLTAALTAAGMSASKALTAVLAYRLLNFWTILIGGWILMIILTRRQEPGSRLPPDVAQAGSPNGARKSPEPERLDPPVR
jgi:uncharacterized protein (TIRG00374 family)